MKILIADDHDLVRDTLAAFLSLEPDLDVSAVESLPAATARIEAEGPFDLVMLDYGMPGMNGLRGLGEAIELNGGRPVALMSGVAPRAVAAEALEAGAAGFLPKTIAAASLVHAVRFMLAGEKYAPIQFMTAPEAEPEAHPLADKLSGREREVLGGLCRGLSNKEIARELELQEVTVKLHVKTLCRKLEARNRTQAAMIAKEAELI